LETPAETQITVVISREYLVMNLIFTESMVYQFSIDFFGSKRKLPITEYSPNIMTSDIHIAILKIKFCLVNIFLEKIKPDMKRSTKRKKSAKYHGMFNYYKQTQNAGRTGSSYRYKFDIRDGPIIAINP